LKTNQNCVLAGMMLEMTVFLVLSTPNEPCVPPFFEGA